MSIYDDKCVGDLKEIRLLIIAGSASKDDSVQHITGLKADHSTQRTDE